jgi:hypothetical protein
MIASKALGVNGSEFSSILSEKKINFFPSRLAWKKEMG